MLFRSAILRDVEDYINNGDLSAVALNYKKLQKIDAAANDDEFFVGNTKARVTKITPVNPSDEVKETP